jgi:hypothetical protein
LVERGSGVDEALVERERESGVYEELVERESRVDEARGRRC